MFTTPFLLFIYLFFLLKIIHVHTDRQTIAPQQSQEPRSSQKLHNSLKFIFAYMNEKFTKLRLEKGAPVVEIYSNNNYK